MTVVISGVICLLKGFEFEEEKAHARTLRALLDAVVQVLEGDPALPDRIPPPREPDTVENPFG